MSQKLRRGIYHFGTRRRVLKAVVEESAEAMAHRRAFLIAKVEKGGQTKELPAQGRE